MQVYFYTNLKILRLRRAVTQHQLADFLGVKPTTISNWEKGKSAPNNYEDLIKISNYFQVSIDDLLKKDLSREEPTAPDKLQMSSKTLHKYVKTLEQIIKDHLPDIAQEIGL